MRAIWSSDQYKFLNIDLEIPPSRADGHRSIYWQPCSRDCDDGHIFIQKDYRETILKCLGTSDHEEAFRRRAAIEEALSKIKVICV